MPISLTSAFSSASDFQGTLETNTVTLDASALARVADNVDQPPCKIVSSSLPMIQPRWGDSRGAGLIGLGLSTRREMNLAPDPQTSYLFVTADIIADPTVWSSVDTGVNLRRGLTRKRYAFSVNAGVSGVSKVPAGRCNYFPFDSAALTYLTPLFRDAPLGLYFAPLGGAAWRAEFVAPLPAARASWAYQQNQMIPWWWFPTDTGSYSSFADAPRPAIAGDSSAAVYFQPDLSPIDDYVYSTSQRTALTTMQVIGPGYRRTSLRSHPYLLSMFRGLPSASAVIAWNSVVAAFIGAAAPTWTVYIYYYDSSLVIIGSGVVLQTGTCTYVGTKYGSDWYGNSDFIDFSAATPPSNARYYFVDTSTASGAGLIYWSKLDELTGSVFGTRPFPWPSVNVETGAYKPGIVIDL